jgi:hypothetical protein
VRLLTFLHNSGRPLTQRRSGGDHRTNHDSHGKATVGHCPWWSRIPCEGAPLANPYRDQAKVRVICRVPLDVSREEDCAFQLSIVEHLTSWGFWMESMRGICRRSQFLREECACQLWAVLVNIRGSSGDLPACFFGAAYSGICGEL